MNDRNKTMIDFQVNVLGISPEKGNGMVSKIADKVKDETNVGNENLSGKFLTGNDSDLISGLNNVRKTLSSSFSDIDSNKLISATSLISDGTISDPIETENPNNDPIVEPPIDNPFAGTISLGNIEEVGGNYIYYAGMYNGKKLMTYEPSNLGPNGWQFATGNGEFNWGNGGIVYELHSSTYTWDDTKTEDPTIKWSGSNATSCGGSGSTSLDGENNTNIITNSCSIGDTAAHFCKDLRIGGYDDWFLPSGYDNTNGELYKLRQMGEMDGGIFYGNYWSSTEESYAGSAMKLSYYINATNWGNSSKDRTSKVHCVRLSD